jgi:hypothetical protein
LKFTLLLLRNFSPLLHAIAEANVGDRQSEKRNRYSDPKDVFHHLLRKIFLQKTDANFTTRVFLASSPPDQADSL